MCSNQNETLAMNGKYNGEITFTSLSNVNFLTQLPRPQTTFYSPHTTAIQRAKTYMLYVTALCMRVDFL